ncbi:putative aarF domain-containing protein kinase 2 [Formica fusca]
MSLRSNFARFLASLRRCRADVARGKWEYRRRCFRTALTRLRNGDLDDANDRNFASATTTLSRNPRIKIREPQTIGSADEGDDGERKSGVFLEELRETVLILARIVIVSSVVTTLIAAYLITRLTHANLFPTALRTGIEFLGPIFVKFGQWISTRRDIFSRDICDTLSRLQRDATPHSWLYTERLLEATYGSSWRDLFAKFDDEGLIGSGCCAQVYKAWIDLNAVARKSRMSRSVENKAFDESDEFASTSTRARKLQAVAVKVLHPGIKGQLKRDIAIMRGLSKCAMYFVPELHWLSLTDCIDEFARIMEDQVDMRLEAANLARFSANFSRRNDIVFPYPYMHLTRRRILVESFHEGTPISDYLEHDDAALQRKLARIGIATIFKMIFDDNFIHCDLHPGNILVEKAVVPKAGLFNTFRRVINPDYVVDGPRLIILDCGLVVSLNDRCRQNLRDVFYSVLMGNGEMAAQYILEHSSYMTPDPDGFRRSMRNIVKFHLRNPFNVNVSTVVSELFSAMVRHRVKQDGSFSGVILSMLVIEGLGRCLDPNIDIFAEILPFILSSIYNDSKFWKESRTNFTQV